MKNRVTLGHDVGTVKTAYIDAIDFECEVGSTPTRLFESVHSLFHKQCCAQNECGAYKLEIKAVEYIPPKHVSDKGG